LGFFPLFLDSLAADVYRIKICGVTTPEDALLAAEAGADAIGLNFYEKSPRYVTAERATQIVQRLRDEYPAERVTVFGVFVNAALDDILWTIREADLYGPNKGFGIQLHGDEPPDLLRELNTHGLGVSGSLFQATGHVPEVPIVRAFRHSASDLSKEAQYLVSCQQLHAMPQAVLIDAAVQGAYGGTGARADWSVLASRGEELFDLPLVLAGGLNPNNVMDAVSAVRPTAVDVASGVESTAGTKDPAKVYEFVATAKRALRIT